jgi:7-cyano-7-deazaguanine synthase
MDSKSVVVLSGGGIDSSVCVHSFVHKNCNVRMLHIDFGQSAACREWVAVKGIAKYYGVPFEQLVVRGVSCFKNYEVVGRNAAFVFLGLMGIRDSESGVCIGIHSGTCFYDSSCDFFDKVGVMVREYTDSRVCLLAPLLNFTKSEIVSFAKNEGVPLNLTYSCQEGGAVACGKCHSCRDREAFGC